MLRIRFHKDNPNKRDLQLVAERLKKGEIAIIPTDSVYALACLMNNKTGIERISKITGKKDKFIRMSLLCPNISAVSEYTSQIPNHIFRDMNKNLPGPYTYILKSNKFVQKFFQHGKDQIGIRIPNNTLVQELLKLVDVPLIATSLSNYEDEVVRNYTDPDDIDANFQHKVDVFIDCGPGNSEETTVIDCTSGDMELIRPGRGDWEE